MMAFFSQCSTDDFASEIVIRDQISVPDNKCRKALHPPITDPLRYSTSFDAVYCYKIRFNILYFYPVPVEFYLVVNSAVAVQIAILIKVTLITCPVCAGPA